MADEPVTTAENSEANLAAEAAIADNTIVKPIELDDAHGRWVFEPQPDITAYEAMLISQLFAAMTVRYLKGDRSRLDWREYLARQRSGKQLYASAHEIVDLARHFRKE